jgi:signal peptidase I
MKGKDILQAALVLLIAVFLVNTLTPFFKGTEKPLIVLSGSMVPFFLPGEMVITKSIDPKELKIGDVMIFNRPGGKPDTLITHRIISIEEGENRIFQTKGDANGDQDFFKVPASNAVGKLIFVIPFAGYLPDLTKRYRSVFLLIVILPACLLIFGEIKNVILYSNPARARKVEKERKKAARRTSIVIKGKRLAALILISGLVFAGIVTFNLGENGSVILQSENTVDNPGFLSQVFILTPDNSEQTLSIHPWYGVVPPANKTQVTAPENTPAKISSVPYILPIFWIIMLAGVNPYLPAAVEIAIYTSAFILLLLPLWYRKSTIGGRRKRIRLNRRIAQWKRTLHIG